LVESSSKISQPTDQTTDSSRAVRLSRWRTRGLNDRVVFGIIGFGLVVLTLGVLAEIFNVLLLFYTSKAGGSDFAVYLAAARHLINGQSPYSSSLLMGPFAAQTPGAYLYPPTFAWLLVPLLALPAAFSAGVWVCLQLGALAAALWIAARAGGASGRPRLIFILVPVGVFYLPVLQSLYLGQVGTFIALGMALLLRSATIDKRREYTAGPLASALVVLKITPGLVLVPLLLSRPRQMKAVLFTLLVLIGPFVLLNPGAWLDFLHVPLNLALGNAWYPDNLAPGTVFAYQWTALAGFSSFFHLLAILTALGLLAVACTVARRPGGLPLALIATSSAAILPFGAIWFHYLIILLPGLIFTYLHTDKRGRLAIILACLSLWGFHLLNPIVATLGMLVLMGLPVVLLWSQKISPSLGQPQTDS
jgi:hypothetical protein